VGGLEIDFSFAPPVVPLNYGKVFFTTATRRYLIQCRLTVLCALDGFEEEVISSLEVVLSEGRGMFIYPVRFS
jgi:hypothetical protein